MQWFFKTHEKENKQFNLKMGKRLTHNFFCKGHTHDNHMSVHSVSLTTREMQNAKWNHEEASPCTF
jgi:hypothetical protein